jgi:hypothetical protein
VYVSLQKLEVTALFYSVPITFYIFLLRKLKDQRTHEINFTYVFNKNMYST